MRTNTHPRTILAIDPGLRDIGYAVLVSSRLVESGVHRLKEPSSLARRREAGQWLIFVLETYGPDILILERANRQRAGRFGELNRLVELFQQIAGRLHVPVAAYPPQTVRKGLLGDGWASKRTLADALAQRIPGLRIYLKQDRRWKERFWLNAFDAIALALYHRKHRPVGATAVA